VRALLVLFSTLVLAAPAGAASYTVTACDGPNGTGANHLFKPSGTASGSCDPGLGLHAQLGTPIAAGTASSLVMSAPTGTKVGGYSIRYGIDWASPGPGQWVSMIDAGAGAPLSAPCPAGTCSASLPAGDARWGPATVTRSGLALDTLRLHVACGPAPCATHAAHAWWSDLNVTLDDASAPDVAASARDAWITGTPSVDWSARDNSGIRRTRLEVDGEPVSDDARPCDFTGAVPCIDRSGTYARALGDGIHHLGVRAFDATDANSAEARVRVTVDNLPPVTFVSGAGDPDRWQPGPVTVTLSAHDAGAGMGSIRYSLDGGAARDLAGDHAEVPIAGNGAHTVAFRAVDALGHASDERTVAVRIGTPRDGLAGPGPGFGDRALNADSTFSAARSFAASCPDTVVLRPDRRAQLGGVTLLGFPLPPARGCGVASAHLSAAGDARRLSGSWDEGVTAATRPGAIGPVAVGDVTELVDAIYRYGDDGLEVAAAAPEDTTLTVSFR
jgi:hypothetical protein